MEHEHKENTELPVTQCEGRDSILDETRTAYLNNTRKRHPLINPQ